MDIDKLIADALKRIMAKINRSVGQKLRRLREREGTQ
jgi:hypothetical protein